MNIPKITRRQWLKGIGTAILGYIVLRPDNSSVAASLASNQADVLAGTIERIEQPRMLHLKTQQGPAVIKLTDNAAFWRARSGRVAGLNNYTAREEVVAEGQWFDNVFVAAALMRMSRFILGRILAKQGDRLLLTSGTILRLIPETKALGKPIANLAAGDTFTALSWFEPSSNDRVILAINAE